jgi:hypothetical protein
MATKRRSSGKVSRKPKVLPKKVLYEKLSEQFGFIWRRHGNSPKRVYANAKLCGVFSLNQAGITGAKRQKVFKALEKFADILTGKIEFTQAAFRNGKHKKILYSDLRKALGKDFDKFIEVFEDITRYRIFLLFLRMLLTIHSLLLFLVL